MTPSLFHVPPRPSADVGEHLRSAVRRFRVRFSLPSAKKPIDRPSGCPERVARHSRCRQVAWAVTSPRGRSQRRSKPFRRGGGEHERNGPSGDRAKDPADNVNAGVRLVMSILGSWRSAGLDARASEAVQGSVNAEPMSKANGEPCPPATRERRDVPERHPGSAPQASPRIRCARRRCRAGARCGSFLEAASQQPRTRGGVSAGSASSPAPS